MITLEDDDSSSDTDHEPEFQASTPSLLKQGLFRSATGVERIYEFLKTRVKNQDTGLYNVATTVSTAMWKKKSSWGEGKPLLYKMTLSGTSGCGKTETVLAVRHYLGMDTGYEYENQFIEIDGSTMQDETQVNCLTGAAAGLIGYKDGYSLSDRLNKAINKPITLAKNNNKKKKASSPMPFTKKRTTPKKAIPPPKEPDPPPFIFLFVDEVDKVCEAFMLAINGLIETGNYHTPSGIGFQLPKETAFFIMFTANYGAEAIAEMPRRNDEAAEKLVLDAMDENGLKPHTVARMGQIIPYYPLEEEALKALLSTKLEEYIQQSPLLASFLATNKIRCDENVKNILLQHVLQKVSEVHGVRGAIRQIFQKLDLMFDKAFDVLQRMVDAGDTSLPLTEPLELTGHSINMKEFENSVEHEWNDIIRLIKSNPANEQSLARWREETPGGVVNTMGMKLGGQSICNFVMHYTIINHHHHHVHNHRDNKTLAKKVAQLRDESRVLKKTLDHVFTLANESTSSNHIEVVQQIRDIANEKQVLIKASSSSSCSSSSSEDEMEVDGNKRPKVILAIKNKKRKNEEEEERDRRETKRLKESQDESDESSTENRKRGRRPKPIPGFTYSSRQSKHSYYICNDCCKEIASRYIPLHHCIETNKVSQ
jgi:hypothetical protein